MNGAKRLSITFILTFYEYFMKRFIKIEISDKIQIFITMFIFLSQYILADAWLIYPINLVFCIVCIVLYCIQFGLMLTTLVNKQVEITQKIQFQVVIILMGILWVFFIAIISKGVEILANNLWNMDMKQVMDILKTFYK